MGNPIVATVAAPAAAAAVFRDFGFSFDYLFFLFVFHLGYLLAELKYIKLTVSENFPIRTMYSARSRRIDRCTIPIQQMSLP